MAIANTTLDIPNPYVYLAFLPPTIANQFQVSICVAVAGLSVYVWDWLICLPTEYKLLTESKFSISNSVYLISRMGTLGFCVMATIFQAADIDHCQTVIDAATSFYVCSVLPTALLFYFRVRAIWSNSMLITVVFGLLWLANLGASILIVFAVKGDHIGPTQRCIETSVNSYASVVVMVNASYDTLIFIVASVRIVMFTCVGDTWNARFRSFFNGNGLPRISKSLLQSGQLYYLASLVSSVFMAAMVMAPSIPPVYCSMVTIPSVAIENILSCYVFRAIKLGFIKDDVNPYNRSTSAPRSRMRFEPGFTLTNSFLGKSRDRQVNVESTTATDATRTVEDGSCKKPKDASDASDRV